MISFKEFVTLVETKAILPEAITTPVAQPRSDAAKPVQARLAQGWAGEDLVINALNYYVGPTSKSSARNDLSDSKVDAVVHIGGEEVLVQIKARQSGNDIIVEWWKNYDRREKGRDQITRATAYAVLDSQQKFVYLIDAKLVKETARTLISMFEQGGGQNINNRIGQVKLQQSYDARGASKVMVYLPPAQFQGKVPPGFPTQPLEITDEVRNWKPEPAPMRTLSHPVPTQVAPVGQSTDSSGQTPMTLPATVKSTVRKWPGPKPGSGVLPLR